MLTVMNTIINSVMNNVMSMWPVTNSVLKPVVNREAHLLTTSGLFYILLNLEVKRFKHLPKSEKENA